MCLKKILYILVLFVLFTGNLSAQDNYWKYYYSINKNSGDTLLTIHLPQVVIYEKLVFKNEKERMEYTKLVRDVKKTLPYAKLIAQNIIESYEMMRTFETEKEKQQFLEDVQKFMMDKYKPQMKKLTRNQGKILVKLIDRQTDSSSYDIVKSLVGSFKAGLYNTFAKIFGNNLKTKYDPDGEDWMIERIVIEIEQGGI